MHDSKLNPSKLDCIIEIAYKPLKEKGEDAFSYSFESQSLHGQAVFDGCGGSGSWKYSEFKDATGAFVASHHMSKAFLDWFSTVDPDKCQRNQGIRESFQEMAWHELNKLKNQCAPMRVSGSLVKSFPCTASIALMTACENYLAVTALNCGDSRVYFLTPQTGLVQLTVDDAEGNPDPMESLRDSAPMTDQLNGDKKFDVKARYVALTYPCTVICATDGMFGYLRSPMDFEYLILDELMRADSFAQFEQSFQNKIATVTGDDSTCIMSFYGWGTLENIKRRLKKRHECVSEIIRSLDASMATDTLYSELERVWREYRIQTLFDEMQVQT